MSETELTVVGGNSVGDGSAELVDDEDDEDIVIRSRPVDVLLYSQVANGGAEAGRQLAALPLLVTGWHSFSLSVFSQRPRYFDLYSP